MNPEEYTLPPGTRKAFNKQKRLENLLRQKESMDRLERGDPTDAIASMKGEEEFRRKEAKTRQAFYNQELLRQKESMDRLERGDPTDAIASMKGEEEFRRKEAKTRKAFYGKGGKKCKTKKNKRKTKGKRGKKLRSKSIRKRK
jgi:hypothetical protein